MKYLNCAEAVFENVYRAFKIGFSDYVIQIEMPIELFKGRFFGPEGNRLEHSFLAMDGEEPVGLILGGIKEYEGIRTIRCGTMCIHPEYRGKGISEELFRLHKELAVKEGCKQLFLEVIVGNDRAIQFYKKHGYEKIYDLSYYVYKEEETPGMLDQEISGMTSQKRHEDDVHHTFRECSLQELMGFKVELQSSHVNWQNDFDYMEKMDGLRCFGIEKDGKLVSGISVMPTGKTFFLFTKGEERNKGNASQMLRDVKKEMNLGTYSVSCPNNGNLVGFLKKKGFKQDKITQYEMYQWL